MHDNSMAMTRPDRELIAQVMLFSQGFRTAETLASKIVPFFNLCDEQLSPQPHYDFGLRALKAVLASAGILKRERLQSARLAEGNDTSLSVLDLKQLEDVENMRIENNPYLSSIKVSNVKKMDGDLIIAGNDNLKDIDGFANLESVGGNIELTGDFSK